MHCETSVDRMRVSLRVRARLTNSNVPVDPYLNMIIGLVKNGVDEDYIYESVVKRHNEKTVNTDSLQYSQV